MNDQDKGFMDQAIEQAKLDPRRDHPVGAVVVSRDGSFCAAAHGLKGEALEHAEERLFNQTRDVDLTGGTLYTTLEPCMMRYKAGYLPCAHLVSKRKIRRVVIGLLDPNPAITNFGKEFLETKCGVEVELCNPDIQQKIRQLMEPWIRRQEGDWKYNALFSLLDEHKSEAIRSYTDLGFNDVLTIATCKNIRQGWPVSSIRVKVAGSSFDVPERLKSEFKTFQQKRNLQKRNPKDTQKFMLSAVPSAVEAGDSLLLKVRPVKYNVVKYYEKTQHTKTPFRNSAISHLKTPGHRKINFAHALSLHLVVLCSDNKMLLTQRPRKHDYSPLKWSASIERMVTLQELGATAVASVAEWTKQTLKSEIDVRYEEDYELKNVRILAVGLQTGILNVCLFGYAELAISSGTLTNRLDKIRRPRAFMKYGFLDVEDAKILQEIFYSDKEYQPTSRFRMVLELIRKRGFPRSARVFLPPV